jgi:DNA-binding transcriptional regulator YiaG
MTTSHRMSVFSYHHRLSAKLTFYRSLHRSIYQPGRFKTSNLLNLLGEHVEEASEIDLSGLVTSLEKLADLGFSVSSLKDRESLRDYLILQPPKVDSQAIKRWKRLIQRNQRSDLPEQGAITGAQLKEARLRSGLTLEQVAKRVQFSSSKLSKIENGYVSPSPSDRKKLREFFDLL